MSATKILWGQVRLVSAVALIWAATEWTAWRLGFQSQLGAPWFALFGWPVYQPPAFFWWWFAYDAYARDIFVEGTYIAASGGITAIIVAITMSVWRAREVKRVTTDGSARSAEIREVRRAGLLGADGVLLGRWRGEYLRQPSVLECARLSNKLTDSERYFCLCVQNCANLVATSQRYRLGHGLG